jgi:hypothetical protein
MKSIDRPAEALTRVDPFRLLVHAGRMAGAHNMLDFTRPVEAAPASDEEALAQEKAGNIVRLDQFGG